MTPSSNRWVLAACCAVLSWTGATDAAAITLKGVNSGINVLTDQEHPWSGVGLAVLDVDGDGLPDVVTGGGIDRPPELWHNEGGLLFSKVEAPGSGLPASALPDGDLRGIAAADYDNDGDTDLFIANYHPTGGSLLLRNDDGKFSDVTLPAGVVVDGRATTGAWGDYDGDGWLDLHVTRYFLHKANLLFRNQGDGTFVDMAEASGLNAIAGGMAYSYHSLWFDADGDGDSDLYVANDRCYGGNPRNWLWLNQGDGTFVEDAPEHGLDACYDGMGLALGDLQQDGFPDIFMTNVAYGHQLHTSTCGKFDDITDATGTVSFQWGWGALFADLDQNMWPDLYIAHQSLVSADPTDRLFMNVEGTLTEVAATALEIDHGESFVVVRSDLDLDGDQDLIVSRVGTSDTTRVLRNDGPTGHYLRVQLQGTTSNRDGLGAVVEVLAGGMWQRQLRHEAASFGGRGDPALHFGLGIHTLVDELRVHWPSGASEVYYDVAADQLVNIVEPMAASGSPFGWGPERCGDGVDNDCSGGTDEGFPVGVDCTVPSGDCLLSGVVACSPDLETPVCDLPPLGDLVELCGNGVDDDCDALTDEGFEVGAPCDGGTGACVQGGTLVCAPDGLGLICSASGGDGAKELCGNGVDDDCDGDTDEGFDIGAPCVAGEGVCLAEGTLACAADGTSVVCDALLAAPGAELCGDALDNDCDGDTDEGFDIGLPCLGGSGACEAAGLTACSTDGLDTVCDAPTGTPTAETCNGVDDDCDGATDELYDVGAACTLGTGACAVTGVLVCAPDGGATACLGSPLTPTEELCGNDTDDDCDGDTDEDFDVGAVCTVGVGGCVRTGLVQCGEDARITECDATFGPAAAERCGDGVDNDCDGDTDEGFDIGAACELPSGGCQLPGTLHCSAGGYQAACVPLADAVELAVCDEGVEPPATADRPNGDGPDPPRGRDAFPRGRDDTDALDDPARDEGRANPSPPAPASDPETDGNTPAAGCHAGFGGSSTPGHGLLMLILLLALRGAVCRPPR